MTAIRCAGLLLAAAAAMFSGAASAADAAGVFSQVISAYQSGASTWSAVFEQAATWVFWVLATISMVVSFGFLALRKADLGEFFAELVRTILFFGFFLWLLQNGTAIASAIFDGLRQLAGEAAGAGMALTPTAVIDLGADVVLQTMMAGQLTSPIESVVAVIVSIVSLAMLTVVAVNMMMMHVTGWVLIYAGIFFLGFGGSRWTSEMALNYYRTVLGLGVQLMTMILIVGIATSLIQDFSSSIGGDFLSLHAQGAYLIVVLVVFFLTAKLPSFIAGIATGSSASGGNLSGATIGGLTAASISLASGAAMAARGVTQTIKN